MIRRGRHVWHVHRVPSSGHLESEKTRRYWGCGFDRGIAKNVFRLKNITFPIASDLYALYVPHVDTMRSGSAHHRMLPSWSNGTGTKTVSGFGIRSCGDVIFRHAKHATSVHDVRCAPHMVPRFAVRRRAAAAVFDVRWKKNLDINTNDNLLQFTVHRDDVN